MYARAPGIELRRRNKVDYRQLAGFGTRMASNSPEMEPQMSTSPTEPNDKSPRQPAWNPKQSMESLEQELQDLELQENILKLQADIQERRQRITTLHSSSNAGMPQPPPATSRRDMQADRQLGVKTGSDGKPAQTMPLQPTTLLPPGLGLPPTEFLPDVTLFTLLPLT